MEGHGGDETFRGTIAWPKYDKYCYPGKVVDVNNVSDSIRKKLPATAENISFTGMERAIILHQKTQS